MGGWVGWLVSLLVVGCWLFVCDDVLYCYSQYAGQSMFMTAVCYILYLIISVEYLTQTRAAEKGTEEEYACVVEMPTAVSRFVA